VLRFIADHDVLVGNEKRRHTGDSAGLDQRKKKPAGRSLRRSRRVSKQPSGATLDEQWVRQYTCRAFELTKEIVSRRQVVTSRFGEFLKDSSDQGCSTSDQG